MKLECFLIDEAKLDIRPSTNRREWMDATPNRFAYRCLPLTIANAHGWVIGCDSDFEAEWNGGEGIEDVKSHSLTGEAVRIGGHFGSGILTFRPRVIFRTEPGYNLWVGGPPNLFKDGIQPLTGIIETDWMPFPFTMNWKFTRPNHPIRFQKGEPYCFIFPIKRRLVEEMDPVLRRIEEDPQLQRLYEHGANRRTFLKTVQHVLKQQGKTAEIDNERAYYYQMWYMRGSMPDDSERFEEHQKGLEVKPFRDGTEDSTG